MHVGDEVRWDGEQIDDELADSEAVDGVKHVAPDWLHLADQREQFKVVAGGVGDSCEEFSSS